MPNRHEERFGKETKQVSQQRRNYENDSSSYNTEEAFHPA